MYKTQGDFLSQIFGKKCITYAVKYDRVAAPKSGLGLVTQMPLAHHTLIPEATVVEWSAARVLYRVSASSRKTAGSNPAMDASCFSYAAPCTQPAKHSTPRP
ncbi:hypothetical protein FHG87_009826 [Trinorchestia longiramus]|nr:hypothetical protein FHG87_009826 [Trinorchestia longiramus]